MVLEWLGKSSRGLNCFSYKVRRVPTNSCSSINAPGSGDTADAFLAAAKAIGTNEAAVGHSSSFLGSKC